MQNESRTLRWQMLWLAGGWLLVLSVVYLSLAPLTSEVDVPSGDKLAHLVAYGVLMSWFAQIYAAPRVRCGVALALALLGIALEVMQGYTGYRNFDTVDMAANVLGVVVGWVAAPPRIPNALSWLERRLV